MRNRRHGKRDIESVLSELKERLARFYKGRFVSVILYGSYVRAEANENSDIDVAVVLKGKVSPGKEIDRMLDVITELSLKYNTLIAVYPVSENAFYTRQSPIILNVRAEDVRL